MAYDPTSRDPGQQAQAFGRYVTGLVEQDQPVKIQVGFGGLPLRTFVNIDAFDHGNYDAEFKDEYYIFPFATTPWTVADNTVDFIFHQDCFEHLEQREQVMFLAETFRVMKPGAAHRINCPDLIWSMKERSDFSKGAAGVYNEWAGDESRHRSVPTRRGLEELAYLIGFRMVVHTVKEKSISPHFAGEYRPSDDRDQLLGNVFVELIK
jgi:predicted SAM-dependent methyltransferase